MPASDMLAAVLLDRIRRLNRTERMVLMRAAFIGRRFRPALLAGVLALDEERVRAALDEACNLQLVLAKNSTGNWYAFRHALTRDIADVRVYASLEALLKRSTE